MVSQLNFNQIVNDIISGTAANLLAGIILTILALIILDEKKILRPWIFNFFKPFAAVAIQYFLKLLGFVTNPWLRVLIIGYLIWTLNNQPNLLYSILILAISVTLFWRPKQRVSENPAPEIFDGFDKLDTSVWSTKTGNPEIEKDFGKPAPDLGLPMATPIQATNSFLLIKNLEFERGIIECDFYLEPHAVFNIVFFCDIKNDNWYMARYDSRLPDSSDGFLIKDQGHGVNWRGHRMSGTHTSEKQWHKARIEFNSEKASMYRDGELIAEIKNPNLFGKSVGFFNEVNHMHVDNFYIAR
mgnify:FL=1